MNGAIQKVQGEELEEYKKTWYTSKIYRAIKDDDIDLFIEQIKVPQKNRGLIHKNGAL